MDVAMEIFITIMLTVKHRVMNIMCRLFLQIWMISRDLGQKNWC